MKEEVNFHIEKCVDLESCMNWLDELHAETSEYQEWLKMPDEEALRVHHGFGTWVRNTLLLWHNGPANKWFNNIGIYHADDISSIILQSTHRRANNRPLELDAQVKVYRDHWAEYDPKVNKGKMG